MKSWIYYLFNIWYLVRYYDKDSDGFTDVFEYIRKLYYNKSMHYWKFYDIRTLRQNSRTKYMKLSEVSDFE